MPDGAHQGVGPNRALGTILGEKEQPTDEEKMTREEFEAWVRSAMTRPELESATFSESGEGYDETSRTVARIVLEFLEAHPEHRDVPAEGQGEFRVKGTGGKPTPETPYEDTEYVMVREGLDDVMEREGVSLKGLDLTGFMYGWAVNAARSILDLPPVSNPAIMEIG